MPQHSKANGADPELRNHWKCNRALAMDVQLKVINYNRSKIKTCTRVSGYVTSVATESPRCFKGCTHDAKCIIESF